MTVVPSAQRFRELSGSATVVPVSRELVADDLTPVAAFALLGGKHDGAFLLESVVGGERWARYSFVGIEPELLVEGRGDTLSIRENGVLSERPGGLAALQELLAEWCPPSVAELEELDLPRFWGGAVGALSYDIVHRFEPSVPRMGAEDDVDFAFGIGATLVVFDNLRQTVKVIVPQRTGDDPVASYAAAEARLAQVVTKLAGATVRLPVLPLPGVRGDQALPPSSFDRDDYCAAVEQCKEHIRAGDIFQVVLSQRFEWAQDIDPFTLYRALRVVNPSPYMFHVRLPGVSVSGASPETLVRVEDGVATVRPIAGTRPRGRTREEDLAHEESMLADPKERAEHVMLVDLGRNDLGRISEVGGVRITDAMFVERYSHVMHMTSNLEGKVREGASVFDVIAATFPAGTLSGAPKVRAMQIIAALEPTPRHLYGGAVGYIGFDGSADLAIAIRTAEIREGKVALQAGAGIVEASDPVREWEETLHKARAGFVAVEMANRATD